jgi:hypothetical protein
MKKRGGGNLPDSENILAFIEGSEKPEEIVVSAHYDHVGTKKEWFITEPTMTEVEQ